MHRRLLKPRTQPQPHTLLAQEPRRLSQPGTRCRALPRPRRRGERRRPQPGAAPTPLGGCNHRLASAGRPSQITETSPERGDRPTQSQEKRRERRAREAHGAVRCGACICATPDLAASQRGTERHLLLAAPKYPSSSSSFFLLFLLLFHAPCATREQSGRRRLRPPPTRCSPVGSRRAPADLAAGLCPLILPRFHCLEEIPALALAGAGLGWVGVRDGLSQGYAETVLWRCGSDSFQVL